MKLLFLLKEVLQSIDCRDDHTLTPAIFMVVLFQNMLILNHKQLYIKHKYAFKHKICLSLFYVEIVWVSAPLWIN